MSLPLKFSLGVRFSADGFGIISIGDRIKSNRGKAEIIFDASSDLLKELFVVSPLSLGDVSFADILCLSDLRTIIQIMSDFPVTD